MGLGPRKHEALLALAQGLTAKENPCLGVHKNKEKPRDYYANEAVWQAVYAEASEELKDAMDLAYLTGQRPADVLSMRKDDVEGIYLLASQGKTGKTFKMTTFWDSALKVWGLSVFPAHKEKPRRR